MKVKRKGRMMTEEEWERMEGRGVEGSGGQKLGERREAGG